MLGKAELDSAEHFIPIASQRHLILCAA